LTADVNIMKRFFRPGLIYFLPFDPDELSDGLYHANGDLCALTSPQGQVLNGLSAKYKADWEIVANQSTGMINLINWYALDGRGYFPRAGAQPGVKQNDMIRNIEGGSSFVTLRNKNKTDSGPITNFGLHTANYSFSAISSAGADLIYLGFNASEYVPTGSENRPISRALTPAMFLGV
jgi:hypothetical protein